MKTNVYDVNQDFSMMHYNFKKGCVIEIHSLDVMLIHEVGDKDRIISTTPFNFGAYHDALRNDFYDAVRFIYDTRKYISIRSYPKAWRN